MNEIVGVDGPAGPINDDGDGVVTLETAKGHTIDLYVRPVDGEGRFEVISAVEARDD